MLTRARLETDVLDKINEDILEEIKNYVKNKEQPNLWGVNKDQPGFRSYLILLTLYKDLYGVGYNKLKRRIPPAFHMSNDSLSYNIREMMAETLPESLTGAVILADGHYAWGREKESIPGVRFLVPYPENQLHMNTEANNTEARQTPRMVLGKKRQNYNSILEGVRGRVESPFGLMKQRWKALEGKFSDKKDHQHRALVALALAVENLSRRE